MNIPKNCPISAVRIEMVNEVILAPGEVSTIANRCSVSPVTGRKWVGRLSGYGRGRIERWLFLATKECDCNYNGAGGDRIARKRLTMARIAQALGISTAIVSQVLARAGLPERSV